METLPFINPATGEQFGAVAVSDRAAVGRAVTEMRQAFAVWRRRPLADRITLLRQLQEVIIDAADEITDVMNQDTGKSRQDCLIEMIMTVDRLHQYYRHAPRWLRRRRVPPGLYVFRRFYTEPHPYGVVAVLGPWNYPFDLTMPVVCSALLAGNTVVLKPSEVTAATGVLVERLIDRVPELSPFVRVVHGGPETGAALVQASPDLVFLTGSTTTGYKIACATAEKMIPFICELGGKDPMIVLADADLEAAARWGVWGASYNTGQTCMGIERVYVVDAVYDRFLERVLAEVQRIQLGYSRDKNSAYHMGPLTSRRQLDIVEAQLADAVDKGARILHQAPVEGLFMGPTVVVDVTHEMRLMQEETFGPVMPIMRVRDETEALFLANDSPYGLSASVWGRNMRRTKRMAHRLDVGSVNVNDAISHYPVSLLPFGGVKKSGNARTHCPEEVLQFTQLRSYAIGGPPLPFDLATQMRAPRRYRLGTTILRLFFGVTWQQRTQPVRELLADPPWRPGGMRLAGLAGPAVAAAGLALGLLRVRKSPAGPRRPAGPAA